MNVLRMVKLFGWEKKMGDRIATKREEELIWIKKRNFLDLLNQIIKYALRFGDTLRTDPDGYAEFCDSYCHHDSNICHIVSAVN